MSARVPISTPSPISADISRGFGSVDVVLYGGEFKDRQDVMVGLMEFAAGLYEGQSTSVAVVHQDGIVRFHYLREHLGADMAQDMLVYDYLCGVLAKERVFVELGYR